MQCVGTHSFMYPKVVPWFPTEGNKKDGGRASSGHDDQLGRDSAALLDHGTTPVDSEINGGRTL
jgi:hypothetical protein